MEKTNIELKGTVFYSQTLNEMQNQFKIPQSILDDIYQEKSAPVFRGVSD